MHLVSCEHPRKVYNKYLDTNVLVSCGHCDVCKSRKSSKWVSRIELERMCHPYTLFFTLTYSDDFVPKMVVEGETLRNVITGEVHTFKQFFLDKPFMANSLEYVRKRGWICFQHTPYIQNFLKRLRNQVYENENCQQLKRVRYFVATEYGPTTHRVHHHGILFFESKWLAENAETAIAKAWRSDNRSSDSRSLGRIDVQFVSGNASSYVAQYLNCTTHLPAIYSLCEFRPHALFSRCPVIGSLLCQSEEIQRIFNSGASKISVYDRRSQSNVLVSLPPSLENRLYPKIKGFDKISSDVVGRIYEWFCETKSFDYKTFKQVVWDYFPEFDHDGCLPDFVKVTDSKFRPPLDTSIRDYFFKVWFDYSKNPDCLDMLRRRLYSQLNRFALQCTIFNLTPRQYVQRILDYYSNKNMDSLKEQLSLESDMSYNGDVRNTLFVDGLFVNNILERGYLTEDESLILQSYGMDFEDLSDLSPDNMDDFVNLVSRSRTLCDKNHKTKVKNEYVSAHMSNSLIHALYG